MTAKIPRPEDLYVDPEKMNQAMNRAVQEAYRLHKQSGDPIVVWHGGEVVWIPPEEIQLKDEDKQ